MSDLDYAVAAPDDVAPVIYRAIIIQTMALEYMKAMQGSPEPFDLDEAFEAARATWETEWDEHPAPRTIQDGIDAVCSDLEHWADA